MDVSVTIIPLSLWEKKAQTVIVLFSVDQISGCFRFVFFKTAFVLYIKTTDELTAHMFKFIYCASFPL